MAQSVTGDIKSAKDGELSQPQSIHVKRIKVKGHMVTVLITFPFIISLSLNCLEFVVGGRSAIVSVDVHHSVSWSAHERHSRTHRLQRSGPSSSSSPGTLEDWTQGSSRHGVRSVLFWIFRLSYIHSTHCSRLFMLLCSSLYLTSIQLYGLTTACEIEA